MAFIKKVLLKGFKSYKDQTTFEPFDPRINIIVGRNGSGKSNFYDAISFVLCDDSWADLRAPNDRRGLLHDGNGDTSMSGYVEIHFDNSGGRFPTEKDTVIIRRSFSVSLVDKKDEYMVDKKSMTKAEVMSFLESAGFSRSNPYYIVKQGRIDSLAKMEEGERLALLQEVAGTKVFEARKSESERLMEDSDKETKKVDEILGIIRERLSELEKEQSELVAYEELDRKRRAIEYTLEDKEFAEAEEKKKKREDKCKVAASESEEAHKEADNATVALKESERKMKTVNAQIADRELEIENTKENRKSLEQEKAKAELELKDAKDKADRERERIQDAHSELIALDGNISEAEEKLNRVSQDLKQKIDEENDLRKKCDVVQQGIDALCAKQGRSAQFKSKRERDTYLRKEIGKVDQQLKGFHNDRTETESRIAQLRDQIKDEEQKQKKSEENANVVRAHVEERQASLAELRNRRDREIAQRRDLQRRLFEAEGNVTSARGEEHKAQHQLNMTINHDLAQGLAKVREVVDSLHLRDHYYGPVIENFTTDPELYTAVEVTAGGSLFHIIVEDDETAAQILEELNKQKSGRVTFIPLNRLNVKPRGPLPDTTESKPLMSLLKFDPKFQKVFQHIFGKTVLCASSEVAQKCRKEHRCNCVTMDGDQVNRRGVWSGGFYDRKSSRIEAMQALKICREKLKTKEDELYRLRRDLDELDDRSKSTQRELRALETEHQKDRVSLEQLVSDATRYGKYAKDHAAMLSERERALAQMDITIQQAQAAKSSLEAEIGTDMLANLTSEEQKQLADFRAQRVSLEPALISVSKDRSELEVRHVEIENTLNKNLYKRRDELRALLLTAGEDAIQPAMEIDDDGSNNDVGSSAVAVAHSHLEEIEKMLKEANKRLIDAETIYDNAQEEKRLLRDEIDEKRTQQRNAEEKALKCARRLEHLNAKLEAAQQRLEKARRRKESFAVSDEDHYDAMTVEQLMKLLKETVDSLKEFGQVNKKARDQYVSIKEQQHDLENRRADLVKAKDAIEGLKLDLDRKKDEDIERTFRGVSKNFSDVFRELVPGGSASLFMVRRRVVEQQLESEGGEAEPPSSKEKYSGVRVSVQFPGDTNWQEMNGLSGGQKSIVALSLIFAIHRTDPAPFYLFDEIDSNIDDKYRMEVARLIEKQSKDAQFIVTTFRPEIIEHAHKWYGVSTAHGKISSINPISKEDALAIVKPNRDASAVGNARSTDGEEMVEDESSRTRTRDGDVAEASQEGSQSFVPPDIDSQRTNGEADSDDNIDGGDDNDRMRDE